MATFVYDALDPSGREVKGKIEADNEQMVMSRLHEQHFHILSVSEAKASFKLQFASKTQKVKLPALVVFSRQFATMIDAGIPIIKCLDILESQIKEEGLKGVINATKKDVKGGLSLTDALAKHPHVFSKLYVNMIRAAEIGGILDIILDRLAGFLETEMEIKGKVKSAMMYPIIVLCFAGIMVVALFLFVLPRFKEIFISMNVEMPPTTQFLFDASDWLQKFWWLVIIMVTGAIVAVKKYDKTVKGHFVLDGLKLKLPIFGDLVLKMSISRFARTFGTLIASGVPMMRSLEIIGETSGNAVLANAINNARNAIREGAKISHPLAASGLFPSMVTHMIDVGEETGRLAEMLTKVADFYDNEVDAMVKGLTSMIEPLLIVFMGVVVGFIAISVMAPIFKLVTSIH
ncbi:MAG: type II secretion system F family protein [Capsulimonas sp.]|uniref:type II secretion system F family protein n=1 Tax=Capsulimonas sp. TaxID=2494211 RepID=UPI003266E2DB|nr:Type secretion system protein [Capsulimonas sp.]